MKRNPLHYIVVILLVGDLLLAGCALAHHSAFYITQPHNGDVFAASQQVTVRVEVIDLTAYDHSGWTSYEYTISDAGQVIAHVSEESIRQRNVWVNENNPWPGAHYLMVTARAARPDPDYADVPNNTYRIFSDWYTSNEVCFWVGPDAPPDFCSVRTIAQPVVAPTARPTPTPFRLPPTPVPVIDSAEAHPSPIYYGDSCPNLSTISFRASLSLPSGVTPDLIDVQAHVRVVVGTLQTDSGSLLVPLQPAPAQDSSTGGQVFTGTLPLSRPYNDANNHFDPGALGGRYGALLWYVDASSHGPSLQNAVYLGRTLNQVLDLAPCATQNRRHNGGGNGTGCGQYTNPTSCYLGSCSWDSQNNSCSIIP